MKNIISAIRIEPSETAAIGGELNCISFDSRTKALTKSAELKTIKYYPIPILKRTVGQLLLLLEFEDAICLKSEKLHVGRRCAAYEVAHVTGRQYFEITEDDFDLQMENAIRLNSELLFFCRQGSVSANRHGYGEVGDKIKIFSTFFFIFHQYLSSPQ